MVECHPHAQRRRRRKKRGGGGKYERRREERNGQIPEGRKADWGKG